MNKVNVLLFDGIAESPKLVTIDNTLEGFYKAIGCNTIEGYSNTMLGHLYGLDIYLDGEGKIRPDKPKLVGLFVREETGEIVDTLVGNLLICCHDEEGDSTDVYPNVEIVLARKHIKARNETNIPDRWHDRFGDFETAPYLLVLYC